MTSYDASNLTPEESEHVRKAVDVSFEQDASRAKTSYTSQTASALRRRALSQGNGHVKTEVERP